MSTENTEDINILEPLANRIVWLMNKYASGKLQKLSELTGVPRTTLAGYIDKQRMPNALIVAKFKIAFPKLDLNWFLSLEIDENLTNQTELLTFAEPASEYQSGNILHIKEAYAQAGTLLGDVTGQKNLIKWSHPDYKNSGPLYSIVAEGQSMADTISPGDLLIMQPVMEAREITPGEVYVIYKHNDGVLVKRLYVHDAAAHEYELVSDNPIYQRGGPKIVQFTDADKIFRVLGITTENLLPKQRQTLQN